jgi:hypothetical protein
LKIILFFYLIGKIEIKDISATLDSTVVEHQTDNNKRSTKKAKWHLGIRSQSKPQV